VGLARTQEILEELFEEYFVELRFL
jgi:hypothetical protein